MPDVSRKCAMSAKNFVVTEQEQLFLEKQGFPLPTLCIDERHRRRLIRRNERAIYKDKCDLTGKDIISLYSPDKLYTVYSQEAWWGDDWDAKDYGRDFDFDRSFFEQFYDLQLEVPRLSLLNDKAINSEYCNITTQNKNCYLVFGGDINEDCLCSVFCFNCKDSCDLYWVNRSELSYDSIDCADCYNIKYCQNTYNCRDSVFLFNCRRLANCFGCVNLSDKQFYIFNKPYSEAEYVKKLAEFKLNTWSGVQKMKEEFFEFKLQFPNRYARLINSEDCSGDNISNGKNCANCFDIEGPAEDVKDLLISGVKIKDMLSCNHVWLNCELCYELTGSIYTYNCAFSSFIWNSNNVFYSDMCVNNCSHLFGCSNLKKAEYCILNRQYSKEDYFALKDKIIEYMKKTGEWGEFFPMKHSPWAYNETVAQDYTPISKETALQEGLAWHDEEMKQVGTGFEIPDAIEDVEESIVDKPLVCIKSGRPYSINKQELKLYKRLGIPIPQYAPETRNQLRFLARNPQHVWSRKCDKCGIDVQSSFSTERSEQVYCEKCYLSEIN